ncbi:MAG TPA: restriction endonuclease [Streptosporangiaceae bacterium]|nr:restriction endonuclease [Streptosporangiaceae bacterium]
MPEYDFRTLSPTDFEYLVGDVLNADLGLRLHSYPEGRDQGIDLRQVTADGHTTIVQCKHYRKSSPATFLTAVRKEAGKPAVRLADRYVFVTSHDLSAAREDEVARILGIPHDDVWGPRALNDALGRNPDVERRHFKLWLSSTAALDAILHAGRWRRGDALLAEAAHRARYWVATPAYEAVRDILDAEGVCLVTGAPGAGKTFLADMITLAAARDGWQIVDLSAGIEDGWAAAHPTTRQLFYCDDFLGQATLELSGAAAADLVRFISYVRRNAGDKRLILTSREQVLRQASIAISDRLRQLAADPGRYTISLETYEPAGRAEILLNHLHFSDLPEGERDRLTPDNRMTAIARHPSYNPRLIETITARRLSAATADQVLDEILGALDNPELVWSVSFDALGPLAQDIALTLATHPARPVPLAELRPLAPDLRDWRTAITSLEPAWIRLTDDRSVTFAHPGCRDYLIGRLDDADLADEWVGRLHRLHQVRSLTRSAGLLPAEPGTPPAAERPALARALLARRADLAALVERCVAAEPPASVSTLRDAAALLSVFGTPETSERLIERVAALIATDHPLPVSSSLLLAAWLHHLPTARDGLIQNLIESTLTYVRTSRDLDAYEALPVALRTPPIHDLARRRAIAIIDAELAALAAEPDPTVIRETALDLAERARWYGHGVYINPLLDLADQAGS